MSSADKRVSLFLANLKEGGIQRVIVNLARRFTELNLKVDLVVDRAVGPFVDKVCAGVRIVDLKSPRLRKSVSLVANYLKEENPVGIISNMHYNTEIAILAKSLYRLQTHVVVVEHNSLIPGIKPSIKMPLSFLGLTPIRPNNLVRYFYPWADSIVCPSKGVAQDVVALTGLPEERVQTIYNPVITPELVEKAQEKVEHPWFHSPEIPVILGVGRLVDQKDFATLIRAFSIVRKEQKSRLVILGTGPNKPQLEALVEALGLVDDVDLPGFMENPFRYMARASVFVLSSLWEGLPTVLIEAMAVGVPVVSTDCRCGPVEILDNGKHGALVPMGDVQAMAQAILDVIAGERKPVDPAWLDRFRLETVANQYLDLLGVKL